MPNELITLQFGQCGNQIGDAFWRALCAEHAIAPDGSRAQDDTGVRDLKRVFFSQVIFFHFFHLFFFRNKFIAVFCAMAA